MQKINIALVGLGFGGAFAKIYKKHPYTASLSVFDTNRKLEDTFCKELGLESRKYADFDALLADSSIDAVHLVTPIPYHAEQTVKVLESGKHCACTVPMATTLEDIQKIADAVKSSGKNYMMMETTLYTYQYLYAAEMLRDGKFGRIQFLRGSHYQDMENWPDYWMGLPPMHYGTHAIAPMRVLGGSRIGHVTGFGSGTMDESLVCRYGNPFPVETAIFEFENGLKGEATRTLFETARDYQEGMFIYGSDACFEWGFLDADEPYITTIEDAEDNRRGRNCVANVTPMPNYAHLLPEEIRAFTVSGDYDPLNPQETLKKGAAGGHHGSHPHLVHEFLSSIIEERKPMIDETLGGNITAAGICAHISAMQGGVKVEVPAF